MSDYSLSAEDRAELAEYQQRIDDAQAANVRVPTFRRPVQPQQKVTMRSDDVAQVTVPPPAAPTFYAKHSSTPRSGATVGPDDLVEIVIPGMGPQKTSVANALNMGLIARDVSGGYRGLSAGERGDIAQAEQQEQRTEQAAASADLDTMRAEGDAPDADTSRLIEAVARTVPEQAVQQLSYDLAVNGSMSESAIARAAEASGISFDQGKRVATEMIDGLSRQAAAAVIAERVPANMVQDMYDWAAEHHPAEHKAAVLGIAIARDAGALKALARKYYSARVV